MKMLDYEYVCSLSPKMLEVARVELRETESRRDQALEQFRHLIKTHPRIRRCHTDTICLLAFLRVKKYSVMAAMEMLEHHLTALKQFPQFYKNLTLDQPKTASLIDQGYICPLLEKDHLGRQVMFYNGRKVDPTDLTSVDIIRMTNAMYAHLLAEEPVQVAGFVVIVDGKNVNLQLLSMFSITDLHNWLGMVQKGVPIRLKELHIINLPSIANAVLKVALGAMGQKMQKRVFIHSDMPEFLKKCDYKDILPLEYGGKIALDDMISVFKLKMEKYRDAVADKDNQDIEVLKGSDHKIDNVGSFRKLEVD